MLGTVSIGGAVLLCRIIFNLGDALTSERKWKLAGNTDAARLLSGLEDALALVVDIRKDESQESEAYHGETASHDYAGIRDAISNCQTTLERLRSLVAHWTQADNNAIEDDDSRTRILTDDVREALNRCGWTRERGDEGPSEATPDVYLLALNFITTCLVNQRFEWDTPAGYGPNGESSQYYERFASQPPSQPQFMPQRISPEPPLQHYSVTFSLWLERFSDTHPTLSCSRASFCGNWLDSCRPIFVCRCDHRSCPLGSNDADNRPRSPRQSFYLLPASLLVSTAAEREWTILTGCSTESNPVLLVLRDISATAIPDFQRQVKRLASLQTCVHTAAGLSTLAVTPLSQDEANIVRALKAKSSTIHFADKIDSAVFETKGRQYTPKHADFCQLLFYYCTQALDSTSFHDMPYAEMLLFCRVSEVDQHMLFTVRYGHDTQITAGPGPRKIQLSNVVCTCEGDPVTNTGEQILHCSNFRLEFTDRSGADVAFANLKAMQHEVQLSYLRSRRWGEETLFTQRMGDVTVADCQLYDAHFEIVADSKGEKHRMIITSTDQRLSICIKLTSYLTRSLIDRDTVAAMSSHPAWVVRVASDRTTVEKTQVKVDDLLLHFTHSEPAEPPSAFTQALLYISNHHMSDDANTQTYSPDVDMESSETSWAPDTPPSSSGLSTPSHAATHVAFPHPPPQWPPHHASEHTRRSCALVRRPYPTDFPLSFRKVNMGGNSRAVLGNVIQTFNYMVMAPSFGGEPTPPGSGEQPAFPHPWGQGGLM